VNQHNLLLSLLAITALAGCKENAPAAKEATPAAQPSAATPADTPAKAAEAKAERPLEELRPELLDPAAVAAKTPAVPDVFRVRFHTTKGDFVVEARKEWAPRGAERFYQLVYGGFFTDVAFFRAIQGFMVQFGINGSPAVAQAWKEAVFPDDPVKQENRRGMISFATSGPNSRTTQMFINFVDNLRLDEMGFAPFAKVVEGMDVVDSLYTGYGEGVPAGRGPSQGRIHAEGNAFLRKAYPELDYIKSATILGD